jgi:hypothetical protein
MLSRRWLRITFGVLLCLAVATAGFGQSTPPPVPIPSTTHAVIYVITSLAILGTVVYFMIHKHKHPETSNLPSFAGCTSITENGTVLTDEKDGEVYVILPGRISLKTGERVQVLAKKDEDDKGNLALQVGTLVKDYGPCTPAASPSVPPK